MVNRNLIRNLESDHELSALIEAEMPEFDIESGMLPYESETSVDINRILEGVIIRVDDESVLVDVGFKSEGTIPLDEWDDHEEPPAIGQTVQVLVEDLEDDLGLTDDPYGMISLSKRKAEKILTWQEMMRKVQEGEVVTGQVTRKIKGGLLVDIGVSVFLPASQVDIRRPPDIGDYIGRVTCNAKSSRLTRPAGTSSSAAVQADRRNSDKMTVELLLKELEEGQTRKGVVKNIAEFGAFVDLGGIDGLLHITDMSWGRIGHPSEMVSIDQEIEVMILQYRSREGENRARPEAEDQEPVGTGRREVPRRQPRSRWQRGQRDELRGLRQTGGRDRRSGPHQRDVLDQAESAIPANWSASAMRSKSSSSASTRTSKRSRWA